MITDVMKGTDDQIIPHLKFLPTKKFRVMEYWFPAVGCP